MSGWFGWFAGGNADKRSAQESKEAIVKLRQQIEMLRKREAFTEKQITEQDVIARKNIQTNKTAAKAALKRKHQYEQNLLGTQQHINTLETQMNAVENANINVETVKAMRDANRAMGKIHRTMGIDKVDETMGEIQEGLAQAKEISEAISSVNLAEPEDEEELERQLEELEQEHIDNQMVKAPAAPVSAMPNAVKPVAAKKIEEYDEEEELRRLQAEMAM